MPEHTAQPHLGLIPGGQRETEARAEHFYFDLNAWNGSEREEEDPHQWHVQAPTKLINVSPWEFLLIYL